MTTLRIAPVLGALALVWVLSGCGGSQQTTGTPTTAPPNEAGQPVSAVGASIGSEQAAGPFQVTLSTEPSAPKVGETRFTARVTKGGQPVKDATIAISLSMPAMKMEGPEVTLKAASDRYEGTANLAMGGDYEAKTTVSAGGDSGTALFQFTASQ